MNNPGPKRPGHFLSIVKNDSDNRSMLAAALQWSTRITGISMEMLLPGLLGYWLDQRLKTRFVFIVLGIFLGLAVGLWSLLRLVRDKR